MSRCAEKIHVSNPKPMEVVWGDIPKLLFSKEFHEMFRSAQKSHVSNPYPYWGQWSRGSISKNTFLLVIILCLDLQKR